MKNGLSTTRTNGELKSAGTVWGTESIELKSDYERPGAIGCFVQLNATNILGMEHPIDIFAAPLMPCGAICCSPSHHVRCSRSFENRKRNVGPSG